MLPIEIISHLARVLSLTVRLYANMFASDMVILVFFSLIPIVGSVPFLALHAGVSIIQAVRVHAADADLSVAGDSARALEFSGRCASRGRIDISGREPLPPSLHRP